VSGLFTQAGQLRLVGAVLVILGLAHLAMPRSLGWRPEFAELRALTRRIMYTHTYFIGLSCVLLGLAPLTLTSDLLAPGPLPAFVLITECVFWGLRWCAQFIAFPPAVWRGRRLYTIGYVAFTALWTWIVAVFVVALVTTTAS
jgi:hypothetical protein